MPRRGAKLFVVLVHQGAVRSSRATDRTSLLTPIRVRRNQQAVARVGAEGRVEERRHEARDFVVVRIRVVEERIPQAVVERQARRDLPRVGGVHLEVAPALRHVAAGRELREAPGHVAKEEIGQHIAARRAPSWQTASAPEVRVFARAVADRVLVLPVEAAEHARLHEVLAEDLRVVVLDDVQILVVEERRLVPEGGVSRAAPEDRMSRGEAVFLVVVTENRHQAARDLVAQPGIEPAAGDLDLVRRVGELQRVGGAVADGLVERRDKRSARLVPVRVDSRERIVSPQVALNAGRIVCPAVLRVANHDSAGIGQRPVGAAAELAVVDRRRHRGDPVVAAP